MSVSDGSSAGSPVRVWLVEDNALLRRAVERLLAASPEFVCPLAAGRAEEALAALDEGLVPDLVLMDIGLPGLSGIEATRRIRGLAPTARVLMFTVHEEDEKVFAAICAGASGYLLKPLPGDRLLEAIREAARGAAPINGYIARRLLEQFARSGAAGAAGSAGQDPLLTPREREILERLVEGLSLKEIAARLDVSYHTIDTHVRHLYAKLHVRTRAGAVARAVRERLI
jgi:DNA-binding NarL/FixJ family response regulator